MAGSVAHVRLADFITVDAQEECQITHMHRCFLAIFDHVDVGEKSVEVITFRTWKIQSFSNVIRDVTNFYFAILVKSTPVQAAISILTSLLLIGFLVANKIRLAKFSRNSEKVHEGVYFVVRILINKVDLNHSLTRGLLANKNQFVVEEIRHLTHVRVTAIPFVDPVAFQTMAILVGLIPSVPQLVALEPIN